MKNFILFQGTESLPAIVNPNEALFWIAIVAGLGFFLFGIGSISSVLKRMASKKLGKIISKCSSNRFLGLLTGAGFTAAIQSSSATSSLVIGLVRAGVMTFVQAAAIIIGTNIGTTITAFIISIPIAEYLSAVVLVGSFILLLTTRRKWQNIGDLCFAIGCIFFGLTLMSGNLKMLSEQDWFKDMLTGLDKMPWLGLLVGAVLTTCLQSSSAVVGVVQGLYMVSGGTISLFGIIPIILGSNIGTTSTALLACIGGSKESKKVAIFHMAFNLLGSLMFMGIIYIFRGQLDVITAVGTKVTDPVTNEITFNKDGLVDPMVQIALCHLIFNASTAAIFLPLLTPICKLINLIVKDDKKSHELKIDIKELDNKFIKQFPSQGIELARDQVIEMFKYCLEMFKTLDGYLINQTLDDYSYIKDIETSIDTIDRNLNDYLMAADKGELTPDDMRTFTRTLKACKDIERIGDYGENLISFYCPDFEKKSPVKDSENYDLFVKINSLATEFISKTLDVFTNSDSEKAIEVIKDRRETINELDAEINKHFDYISSKDKIDTNYMDYVFVDILNCYERVFSHCSNIAKLFGTDKVYVYSTNEEEHFNKMKERY